MGYGIWDMRCCILSSIFHLPPEMPTGQLEQKRHAKKSFFLDFGLWGRILALPP